MKKFVILSVCAFTALVIQAQTIAKPATNENFRGLSAPSEKVVWASGTHGTYVKTIDGGQHWNVAQVPDSASLDFRDIEAFSADLAYLLAAGPGEQSRIYKTNDGGKTWSLQFTNKDPKGFFDCMGFWDRNHGIVAGDPVNGRFQIIATDNGGRTWTYVSSANLPPAIDGEGAFAASGTCLVTHGKKNVWFATGGSAARVFYSTDRGKTWEVSDTPLAHRKASEGIFSLAFRNAHDGVAVGGDYAAPSSAANNIALTKDGGRSWTSVSDQQKSIYLSAVAYLSNTRLVAVGTAGFMHSDDAGKKWVPGDSQGFNSLAITNCDSKPCYVAAGTNGSIGKFWTVVEVDASRHVKPSHKLGMLR